MYMYVDMVLCTEDGENCGGGGGGDVTSVGPFVFEEIIILWKG
jgi:hypothetical protein